jgi:hypothetical protein
MVLVRLVNAGLLERGLGVHPCHGNQLTVQKVKQVLEAVGDTW